MTNNIRLYLMALACIAFLAIQLWSKIRAKKRKKELAQQVYQNQASPPEYYRNIYRILSNLKLTRSYTARVRTRYEIFEPGSVERIERDTVRSVLLLVAVTVGASVAVMFIHISLYTVLLVPYTIYCVESMYITFTTQRMKRIILGQLRTEIEHIQNNYNHSEDVCDAIYESALNAPFPVKNHLLNIWEVLQADDLHINTEVERYNIRSPLPYLKDLLSCAKATTKYGDNNVRGISNFILKLTSILNAVSAAERIEEERQDAFKGQLMVAFAPIYLKPTVNWFASQMFDIDAYLYGVYGILSTISLFLISLFVFGEIQRRQELDYTCARSHPALQKFCNLRVIKACVTYMSDSNVTRKNAIQSKIHKIGESLTVEQFMAQRLIFAVIGLVATLTTCVFIQFSIKSTVLASESGISAKITEGTTEEEEAAITEFIISVSQAFKDSDLSDDTNLRNQIDMAGSMFTTDNTRDLVAQEITRRVRTYQNAYFKWWYLALAAVITYICSYIPYLLLRRDPTLIMIRSNDEIMRFQTIISCMKDIKRGSTKEVLGEMELSADIFRNTLTDCIDEYSAHPLRALERFQRRERDHPLLQQICTKFIRADRVGLQRAFANLEAEMEECQKTREQKCRFYIRRASNLTYMIAFAPAGFLVLFEAIIPMSMAMMKQMTIMQSMIG